MDYASFCVSVLIDLCSLHKLFLFSNQMAREPSPLSQQQTIFARLPFEILCTIADDLNLAEQKTCTLVCQEWHILFRRILFRVIDTDTRPKFKVFQSILRSDTAKRGHFGHYAQHLVVRDGYMTLKEMEELKMECPNLIQLTFLYDSDSAHERVLRDFREKQMNIRSNRRFFGVPRMLVETLPITMLTLKCTAFKYYYNQRDHGLYFTGLHNLHTLIVDRVFPIATLVILDSIHNHCPKLTRLEIETDDRIYYVGKDAIELDEKLLDTLSQHCDPTRLRYLRMKVDHAGTTRVLAWLRYFALKHRGLETLEMDTDNYHHHTGEQFAELADQTWISLVTGCKRLTRVNFNNVGIHIDLLKIISNSNSLRYITFSGKPVEIHQNAILCNTGSNIGENENNDDSAIIKPLQLLALAIAQDADKDSFFSFVNTCSHLTELSLASSSGYIHFPLWDLIMACPSLQKIRVQHFVLYPENQEDADSVFNTNTVCTAALCSLTLVDCYINSYGVEYVADYCPGIKRLGLHSCCYHEQGNFPVFRVYLPHSHLLRVDICNPSVKYAPKGKPEGSVRLVFLELGPSQDALVPRKRNNDGNDGGNKRWWFAFCREASGIGRTFKYHTQPCGEEHLVKGTACASKCKPIRRPKVIESIENVISNLEKSLQPKVEKAVCKAEIDPLYLNHRWPHDRFWKPEGTIAYYGYASLRFGSVMKLTVNGLSNVLIVNGEVQQSEQV